MSNPHKVGDYCFQFHKLKAGAVVQIHNFRLGFANFILITTATADFYIYDFWLDAEIELAAE